MSALGEMIQHYLDTHPAVKKKDIAAAAGVSPQSVSGWLNGTKTPNLRNQSIIGLAECLGRPVRDVIMAVSQDRGLPVYDLPEDELPPDVTATVAGMAALDPARRRMVAQFVVALLAEEDAKGKKKRGR